MADPVTLAALLRGESPAPTDSGTADAPATQTFPQTAFPPSLNTLMLLIKMLRNPPPPPDRQTTIGVRG